MTRTDFFFFFENHNCQTLTCTCQSSTYSTHFFPTFWKHPDALFKIRLVVGGVSTPKQCGWRRRPQTACLASLIWAFQTGRNHLGPNQDCMADVSEGSISISGGFPLLFWPYGGVHCLEGRLPAFHLSSATCTFYTHFRISITTS
jgi:hypothetical protein